MPEVNKKRVRLWVDALRSGEYEQTQAILLTGTGSGGLRFCCLGVACEVALKHGSLPMRRDGVEYVVTETDGGEHDDHGQELPVVVKDWFGFTHTNPHLQVPPGSDIGDDEKVTAIGLNDDHEWDFNRIADAVEYTYLRD